MKRLFQWSLVALAILSTTAFADVTVAPVAVDGPDQLNVGDVASFRVTGEITSVDWGIEPEVAGTQLADDGMTFFVPTRLGKFTIYAAAGTETGAKLLRFPITIGPPPDPEPDPDPNPYPAPSPEQRAWVLPIRDFLLSQSTDHNDLARLAALYSEVASDAVDGETAGQIRARLLATAAERLSGERLGPTGLADVIEKAMEGLLGMPNIPISTAKSTAALNAVAWAIHEGGGR